MKLPPPRVALLLILLVAACERSGRALPPAAPAPPAPDLTTADPAVREQIETARESLGRSLEDGEPSAERAAAWGELARLYHAYEFTGAAAACYARARELSPSEPRWHYLAGVLAQQQGDLEAARELLETTLEIAPSNPAARIRLAEVLTLLGDGRRARGLLESLLDVPGYEAAARFALGHRAIEEGRPEEAIGHLRRVLELQPDATAVRPLLARALRAAGDPQAAGAAAAGAGRVEVRRPDPLWAEVAALRLGAAAYLDAAGRAAVDGRLDEAERVYRRALAEHPESLEARQGLAGVLAARGRGGEALRLLDEVLDRSPEAVDARRLLAEVHRRLGEAPAAVTEYRRILGGHPDLIDVCLALAGALLEAGDAGAAVAEFQHVLDASPGHLGARLGRASSLAALGRRPEARRVYQEVLAENPGDANARLALAILLAEDGLTGPAEEQLRSLLDSVVEPAIRARAAHNLGNLAAQREAWDQARHSFELALELDPDLLAAHVALGTVMLETGDPAAAAEEFRIVADRRPESLAPRLYQIQALGAAGQLDRARDLLTAARARFGADPRLDAIAKRLAETP